MKILLPPSETKNDASGSKLLDLGNLHFSELEPERNQTIDALLKLSGGPKNKALTTLGISERQLGELERNLRIRTGSTTKAWEIYNGVLYDALDAKSLSATSRSRLEANTLVGSALYGLVAMGDSIAPYRLSGDAVLPKVGALSSFWAKTLTAKLESYEELVIDLRSSIYVKLGPIPKSNAQLFVIPKILERVENGPPKVVSHFNKAAKGRLARALLEAKSAPKNPEQVANIAAKLDWEVELAAPTKSGQAFGLNCIVDSVYKNGR